jgi:chromosome segregation ATPase
MAEDTVAPAPPGTQSTFDKPLGLGPVGPTPAQTKVGDKYRQEFERLTKPQSQTAVEEPPKEEPKVAEPVQEASKEAPAEAPAADVKPPDKPSSPLEAVLSKAPKEEKPAEEPDVLKEFDEKTANWQKAREVMKTQSGELKTLREKVKALETAPRAEPSVVEALTKERDEIRSKYDQQEQKLKAINAEYSDEYQGLISQREGVLGKISSRMKAYGGDANGLIEALALPDGKVKTAQIKEAMAEIDPDDKPRIHALIEQLETHDEKIADFRKDLPKKWDELQSKRDLQLQEQSREALKQLETQYGKVVESIPSDTVTLREVADDVPGGTEWNQEIRSAIEVGLKVLKPDGADFNQSVAIAVKGARYDTLEKRYLQLHSDYTELKKSYNEAAGSSPDFKGGGKPKSETPKTAPKKYHEALAAIKSGELTDV